MPDTVKKETFKDAEGYFNQPFSFKSKNIHSFQLNEAQAQHDRTAIRYHYTSASALMSILKTDNEGCGSIRFTDARYMNDRSEYMFFIKRLLEYMEEGKKTFPHCQEVINHLLLKNHTVDEYKSLHVFEVEDVEYGAFSFIKKRHFLFCLSKENDSLHMWNYYLRNGYYQGYNIGIKVYDFLSHFDYDSNEKHAPIMFFCGNVLYNKKKQEEEIEDLCGTIEDVMNRTSDNSFSLQIGMIYLWTYIESFGLFYKDEAFSDEQEYRIVIRYEEGFTEKPITSFFQDSYKGIEYEYFERNGIIVPCLKVPLIKNAVKQITMAPKFEKSIVSVALEDFLSFNGYQDVKVVQSSIPIRY